MCCKSQGTSLLEVLIALTLLSLSLLGATLSCLHNLRSTQDVLHSTRAWIQAVTLANVIHVHHRENIPMQASLGKNLAIELLPESAVTVASSSQQSEFILYWRSSTLQMVVNNKGYLLSEK